MGTKAQIGYNSNVDLDYYKALEEKDLSNKRLEQCPKLLEVDNTHPLYEQWGNILFLHWQYLRENKKIRCECRPKRKKRSSNGKVKLEK
jgi:hypothetical protein